MKTRAADIQVEDVWRAQERLARVLRPTPTIYSEHRRAYLKLENLQVTGSFKVRGAFNALAAQLERGDARPVIAASAGNHAKGLAWSSRYFGIKAVVVVPSNAPKAKIEGCKSLGAQVIIHGKCYEESEEQARLLAHENNWRFLHAFNDPEVIAGQGTVAVELLAFNPDVVLVPIGGGGLAAGMCILLKERGVRVVGVQVEGVDSMYRALRGQSGDFAPAVTAADGLRVRSPGELPLEICAEHLDGVVLVTEKEVRRTLVELATRDRIVAEGAAATAVAGLEQVQGERRVAVVSGGNIDGVQLFDFYKAMH